MVEAVAMTITEAPVMGMVEVERVTQAAEARSTQVAETMWADKTEAFPLLWNGATLRHAILTAARAAEHPEVAAGEGAARIEVEAEADTKKPLKLMDQIKFFPPPPPPNTRNVEVLSRSHPEDYRNDVFNFFFNCCLLSSPSLLMFFVRKQ